MNLTKLAAIAVVIALIAFFALPDHYEHSVAFQGKEFQHAESVGHGGLTSYFYTPTGGNPGEANEFIQLVVFDKGQTDSYRSSILRQTTSSFKLKPFGSDGSTYLGKLGGKGQEVYVYARDSRGPGVDSIAIYVTGEDMDESQAQGRAEDVFFGLSGVQGQFN